MPTKRQRRAQKPRRVITPAVVAAWRAYTANEPRYLQCIREPTTCDSLNPPQAHCAPCCAYLDASLALDRAFGLPPWQAVEDFPELVEALDAALTRKPKRRRKDEPGED